MNWPAYNWPFAFIKASEGTVEDQLFQYHWQQAKGRTIRSAYHYFRPYIDPKQSVIKLLDYMKGDNGELPPALDVETTDGRSDTLLRAKSWMSWYEQFTGVRPIFYSSPGFLTRTDVQADKHLWLKGYKLWLAQYPYDKMLPVSERSIKIRRIIDGVDPVKWPAAPAPFEAVTFWQWTARALPEFVPGYYTGTFGKKEVDLNFYPYDMQHLIHTFDIIRPDPDDEGEQPTMATVTLRSNDPAQYRTIRKATNYPNVPHILGQEVGRLQAGSAIAAQEGDFFKYSANVTIDGQPRALANDVWWRVQLANGTLGWIAEVHLGRRYLTVEQPAPPPPPPDTTPNKSVVSMDIVNPEAVRIHWSDGSTTTYP